MRRERPPLLAAAGAALILGLGACGWGSGGGAAGRAGSGSGSARDVFAKMQHAMADVKSFHFSGTSTDRAGRSRLAGDVSSEGNARFTVTTNGATFGITVVGRVTYMKAGRAFWVGHGGGGATGSKLGDLLGGKWVKIAPALAGDLTRAVKALVPRELSFCLGQNLGTLVSGGSVRFGGRQVTVVRDEGDRPGTARGLYSVASSGTPYLLAQHQTSARSAGGHPSTRCGYDQDTSTNSDVTLSRFDAIPPITVPPGAIDLGATGGPAGGNTTA